MKITTKKVMAAIEKIERATGNVYSLRDNAPDARCHGKYYLYCHALDGFQVPGLYGSLCESFKTQKEFVEWVNENY